MMRSPAIPSSSQDFNPKPEKRSQIPGPFSNKQFNEWVPKYRRTIELQKRPVFYPCRHEGGCDKAKCRCFVQNQTCEKSCQCPPDCDRRFRGCPCKRQGKICWQNKNCPCFVMHRECDGDLCGTCGASEILDPLHKHDENITKNRCGNVNIQRNVPKCTRIGSSQSSGYGLYTGEPIRKDEFIAEYRGEVVSRDEIDRRGVLDGVRPRSYVFSLNSCE